MVKYKGLHGEDNNGQMFYCNKNKNFNGGFTQSINYYYFVLFFFLFFFFSTTSLSGILAATLAGRLGDLSFWYKLIGQFLSPYTIMPGLWLQARNGASGVSNQVTWEGLSAWRIMAL